MLTDLRSWPADRDLTCDVCVLGAGAAGITLATELADTGLAVYLLDGGGLTPEADTQDLFNGESAGHPGANPGYCRLRYFGGTTNHWQGWCAPLSDDDFAARAWVPLSGWPIDAATLAPYYRRAAALCQLGDDPLSITQVPALLTDSAGGQLQPGQWRFSPPTRFGPTYRDTLQRADNVEVLLHANFRRFETDAAGGTIRRLHASTLTGRTVGIAARIFVLACGGLENPRLLLLSDEAEAAGLGNSSGMVGRCFMQHIEVDAGRIVSAAPQPLAEAFAARDLHGGPGRHHWRPASGYRAEAQGLSWGAAVNGRRQYSAGYDAAQGLWNDLKRGNWPDDLGPQLRTLLADFSGLVGDLYDPDDASLELTLRLYGEQAPNPDSRVTLTDRTDALGLRRLRVDWRLGSGDRQSLQSAAHAVGTELGARGLGRLQLAPWLRGDSAAWPDRIWGGCHHLGTTRMADDPGTGVVDRNCRMHTVDNLYVAGSSVFPTGGYVPPTLTIVALACRLADHLKTLLGERTS